MEFPLYLKIVGLKINGHVFFEIMAHMVGLFYFRYLRKKSWDHFSKRQRIRLIFYAVLGAIIGSKLIGIAEGIFTASSLSNIEIHNLFRSKTIVGGLLGGLISVELFKKLANIKESTGDLYVFPLITSIIVGRIGCFSAGVFDGTHGTQSTLPWALNMGDGVLRHPTQLYEVLFLFCLGWFLYFFRHKLKNGNLFKCFLSAYLLFRLFIEFIKPVSKVALNLSAIQWACIFGLAYYLKVFILSVNLFRDKHARS